MLADDDWLSPHRPVAVTATLRTLSSPLCEHLPEWGELVQAECAEHDLSPLWLLARAQLEQQLVEGPWGKPAGGVSWQRRLDWCLGYGATDGGDRPGFSGWRNQIQRACAGLRRYLAEGDSLYAGRLVGKPVRCHDGTVAPANLGTACLLQYTPDIAAALLFAAIYRRYAAAAVYDTEGSGNMTTGADVAWVAEMACAAHAQGHSSVTINGVTFDLVTATWCNRFVRQCMEAALGIPEFTWLYRDGQARGTERKLRGEVDGIPAAQSVTDPLPGDVVCMNLTKVSAGHIGLYVGNGYIAHNTSNTTWGPGTVRTALKRVKHLVSGYYRTLPGPQELETEEVDDMPDIRVKLNDRALPGVTSHDGAAWVPLRVVVDELSRQGLLVSTLADHLADQNAIYWYARKGAGEAPE